MRWCTAFGWSLGRALAAIELNVFESDITFLWRRWLVGLLLRELAGDTIGATALRDGDVVVPSSVHVLGVFTSLSCKFTAVVVKGKFNRSIV